MSDLLSLQDSHAHLDDPVFANDLEEVLRHAAGAGLTRILTVGSDLSSSKSGVRISAESDLMWAAVGLHPHQADRFQAEAEDIESLLTSPKVIAVGEIGLDYFRDPTLREVQVTAFRAQLEWASQRNLPVSVHNRNADEDVLNLLAAVPVTAVLHCYSGSWGLADRALALGAYLSFAGNLTYPKATELREIATQIPIEKVLIETDSPVLTPQAWRGRRNEPSFIAQTFETLGALRELEPGTLSEALATNGTRVFGWGVL